MRVFVDVDQVSYQAHAGAQPATAALFMAGAALLVWLGAAVAGTCVAGPGPT